ncbi:MAG: hypothetical protein PHV61_08825 [Limnochordia bacterium]|nr:hypothetical protein [Limnochordia bacterium]MDD4518432.1 hypothetical protein [Limnochordia bacterium]
MKKALFLIIAVIIGLFVVSSALAYDFLTAMEKGAWIDYVTREPLNTELFKNISPRQLMLEGGKIHVDVSREEGGLVAFYSMDEFNEIDLAFKFRCLKKNEGSQFSRQLFRIDVFAENQTQPDWGGGEQFVEVFFELHQVPKVIVTSKPYEASLVSDIDINIADGEEHNIRLKATSGESGTAWFKVWFDGVVVFDHEVKQVNPTGGVMFIFTPGWGVHEAILTPLNP